MPANSIAFSIALFLSIGRKGFEWTVLHSVASFALSPQKNKWHMEKECE
jgi:hypothetical protein